MLKFKITLFVVFFFPFVSAATVVLDRIVAVVNKEVITWSELYKAMESEARLKALTPEERMRIFKDNEAAFLERLIDMKLMIQEAKRLGIEASTAEVTRAIENIKEKYFMTDTDFIESLKQEGLTLAEYKKRLREQITIEKVVNHEVRNKIVVSDDEIRKYIEANKDIFSSGEAFKLRQIFLKRPEREADKKVVEEKALLIIQRLRAGEDFSQVAKECSEEPAGRIGGEIGIIRKAEMAKEFIDVVSKMNVGDFSMPFWTENGLHIIKLDGKISEENIENVRRHLAEEKFPEKYKSWIKNLREKAYIEIKL